MMYRVITRLYMLQNQAFPPTSMINYIYLYKFPSY